jgi:hypothetical protein
MIGWIIGGFIAGMLMATFLDEVVDWAKEVYYGLKNTAKGIVRIIKRGSRIFKRLVVTFLNYKTEEYYEVGDTGYEISETELDDNVRRSLNSDGYVNLYAF